MNPLQLRLAALRRRLRLVITFRGTCWLIGFLLLALATACWLDWRLNLPSLVRAVLLVSVLSGAGYLGLRYLWQPLRARADDLALALHIEKYYPGLNDCLASTVQFLEQPAESDRF